MQYSQVYWKHEGKFGSFYDTFEWQEACWDLQRKLLVTQKIKISKWVTGGKNVYQWNPWNSDC